MSNSEEKINKFVIVGNGLDISLGMKTSYSDFISSEIEKYNITDNVEQELYNINNLYLKLQNGFKMNWQDFETVYENEIIELNKKESIRSGNSLSNRVKVQELNKFIVKLENSLWEYVKNEYTNFEEKFKRELNKKRENKLEVEQKYISDIFEEIFSSANIINFNYTNTLELMLNEKEIKDSKIHYIHGNVESNNILVGGGFSGNEKEKRNIIIDESFVNDKLLRSKQDNIISNTRNTINTAITSSEEFTLYILGHSLIGSDYKFIEELLLKANKIILFYHEKDYVPKMEFLISILDDKSILEKIVLFPFPTFIYDKEFVINNENYGLEIFKSITAGDKENEEFDCDYIKLFDKTVWPKKSHIFKDIKTIKIDTNSVSDFKNDIQETEYLNTLFNVINEIVKASAMCNLKIIFFGREKDHFQYIIDNLVLKNVAELEFDNVDMDFEDFEKLIGKCSDVSVVKIKDSYLLSENKDDQINCLKNLPNLKILRVERCSGEENLLSLSLDNKSSNIEEIYIDVGDNAFTIDVLELRNLKKLKKLYANCNLTCKTTNETPKVELSSVVKCTLINTTGEVKVSQYETIYQCLVFNRDIIKEIEINGFDIPKDKYSLKLLFDRNDDGLCIVTCLNKLELELDKKNIDFDIYLDNINEFELVLNNKGYSIEEIYADSLSNESKTVSKDNTEIKEEHYSLKSENLKEDNELYHNKKEFIITKENELKLKKFMNNNNITNEDAYSELLNKICTHSFKESDYIYFRKELGINGRGLKEKMNNMRKIVEEIKKIISDDMYRKE